MTITVPNLVAFVSGVLIPMIVVLFGRESIGKLLLGKQHREDTALTVVLDLVKESVAGWREATAANMALTGVVERINVLMETHDKSLDAALLEYRRVITHSNTRASESFRSLHDKLDALINILADDT